MLLIKKQKTPKPQYNSPEGLWIVTSTNKTQTDSEPGTTGFGF